MTTLPGAGFSSLSLSERATLMNTYSVFVGRETPSEISDMRARRPSAALYWQQMPQFVKNSMNPDGTWNGELMAGEDWSFLAYVNNTAYRNNWLLKRTAGRGGVPAWNSWAWLNFTDYCPPGTEVDDSGFTDPVGLTAAEWLARVLPEWVTRKGWSPTSQSYNGIVFEVIAERAWWGWMHPACDEDGVCDIDFDGDGTADSLSEFNSALAITTVRFLEQLRSSLGDNFPLIFGGDSATPDLRMASGLKQEDFLRRNGWSWQEEFFGGPVQRQRGYEVAAAQCIDQERLTLLEAEFNRDVDLDQARREKFMRLGLGTALLKDGIYLYNILHYQDFDLGLPFVFTIPEYYINFGALADIYKIVSTSQGEIYQRDFFANHEDLALGKKGWRVAVNPNSAAIDGVPAQDARFENFTIFDNLNGTVSLNGAPLAGVLVDGGALGMRTSDEFGSFVFAQIERGTQYSLRAVKEGFIISPVIINGRFDGEESAQFLAEETGGSDDDSGGGVIPTPSATPTPIATATPTGGDSRSITDLTPLKAKVLSRTRLRRRGMVTFELQQMDNANYNLEITPRSSSKTRTITSTISKPTVKLKCRAFSVSYTITSAGRGSSRYSDPKSFKACPRYR